MALSAANAVQAKTGTADSQQTISVTLDNPTSGSGDHTVIVEMFGPTVWPGMPAGWESDCFAIADAPILWAFRRPQVPAGLSSWDWTWISQTSWLWRVTEWDSVLDPVGPFEVSAENSATGASVSTLSTGTTPTTNRAEVVALATHVAVHPASNTGMTLNFSGHASSFTERAEQRLSLLNAEWDASWSWLFAQAAGTFECTATVNNSAPAAGDSYYALMAVYAATSVPLLNPGGTVVVG
jgi:hypothetical protein